VAIEKWSIVETHAPIDAKKLFTESQTPSQTAPTESVRLKFLYVKENHKFEIHMELEWLPVQKQISSRQ
jgi:hypothetical protein